MKENGVVGNSVDQCEAVSEIIGVVLMISLAVIGVGIVSVIVIGQDTPVEVPSLTMIPASGETDLFLYHTGGDSLKRGEFVVRVDGVDYSADNINIIDQGGNIQSDWDSWDLGESLMIEGKSDYNQILILSVRGGGATVIAGSGEAAITPTSTATATETATPVPGPNAEFSADSTSGYVPFTVTFTDLSTNTPTSWSWSFGDGNTSTSPDPVYTYYSPGTYDVSLTVSNAGGSDTETKTGYINVTGTPSAPVANFTADATSGTAPLDVTFTDLSLGNPTSWLWDFGDGGNSTAQNPVYTYSSPGTYTVTLNATNAGGSDTEVKTDYITVTPPLTPAAWWKFDETSGTAAADSSGNNNNGMIYGSVLHDPAGACDGALYFDGTSTYVLVPDSNTLDAPAYLTYTAWLRPEPPEPSGFDNYTSLIDKGENDEDNYELFVSRVGSNSEFTFETYAGYFRDYSTNAFTYDYYKWQHLAFVADTDTGTAKLYVDGDYAATLTSGLPSFFQTNDKDLTLGRQQYNSYNLYYRGLMDDVMLFTTALTDEQIGEIYDRCTPSYPPVAEFSADETYGEAPLTVTFTDHSTDGPTSWLWDFGDGNTSTDRNPVHEYTSGGTYTVSLTAASLYGSDTEVKTDYIEVSEPRSDILLNTNRPYYFESGGELEFEVTGSWSYLWFEGSRIDLPQGTNVRIVLKSDQDGSVDISSGRISTLEFDDVDLYVDGVLSGSYGSVSGTYVSGYSDVHSTLSIIVPYPGYSVSTYLTVDGDVILPWSPVETPEVHINNIYPNSGGVFRISSATYLQCGAESYDLIEPSIPPVAQFSGTPTYGWRPMTVDFTDLSTGDPTSWSWDFGDGQTSTEQNPTHVYMWQGWYDVSLTVTNAHGSDTITKTNYLRVRN